MFAYRTERLLEVLEDLAGADGGLEDFGHALLPRMVEDGNAFEYRFDGYWRDVGTVDAYWESHMDLVEPGRGPVLADPGWPMLTLGVDAPPSRIEPTARLDHGLVSSGCTVAGAVGRSVLSPGVVVEEGATVTGSVLLHDVRVRAGARVERAVVDQHADIGPGATVGGPDGEITLVGEHARVEAGARRAGDPGAARPPAARDRLGRKARPGRRPRAGAWPAAAPPRSRPRARSPAPPRGRAATSPAPTARSARPRTRRR